VTGVAVDLGVRPGARDLRVASAIAAGTILLLVRLDLSSDPHSAAWFLGAVYVALGAISMSVPLQGASSTQILHPAAVIGIGLLALAGGVATTSAPFPLRVGPEAVALSALAAAAEEAFFRRLVYGSVLHRGVPAAILLSGVVFALVHIPAYGMSVFWIDLGAGLLLGWQRWASGGLFAPTATHMAANFVAAMR
jgi:membrane protease YdiL (CAAX protease family)